MAMSQDSTPNQALLSAFFWPWFKFSRHFQFCKALLQGHFPQNAQSGVEVFYKGKFASQPGDFA